MPACSGETDENWKNCIERTLALSPDSVTIYQMELPYNTTISGNLLKGSTDMGSVAGWDTKRRWVAEAFEALERAGYHIGSAYTAVKDPERTTFAYRDRLWEGADLVGIGVASFGHINGVHVQNVDTWERYAAALDRGRAAARPRLPSLGRRAADPRVHPAAEARRRAPRRTSRRSTAPTRSSASSRSSRRCNSRDIWRSYPRTGSP